MKSSRHEQATRLLRQLEIGIRILRSTEDAEASWQRLIEEVSQRPGEIDADWALQVLADQFRNVGELSDAVADRLGGIPGNVPREQPSQLVNEDLNHEKSETTPLRFGGLEAAGSETSVAGSTVEDGASNPGSSEGQAGQSVGGR